MLQLIKQGGAVMPAHGNGVVAEVKHVQPDPADIVNIDGVAAVDLAESARSQAADYIPDGGPGRDLVAAGQMKDYIPGVCLEVTDVGQLDFHEAAPVAQKEETALRGDVDVERKKRHGYPV